MITGAMGVTASRHATVVAYLALFTALAGTSYAVTKIDSGDVVNGSLRTQDLKDGKGVTGRDVRANSLTGAQIREKTLDLPASMSVARGGGGFCDPTSSAFVECARGTLEVSQSARVLGIASGGFYSEGGPSQSSCIVRVDGAAVGDAFPGELSDNTSLGASDGFTVTGLSETLPAGTHTVTLECNQVVGDARISGPVVAALGVSQ